MFPLFDIWRLAILEPPIAQPTPTPVRQIIGIKQRIDLIVAPRDTSDATASNNNALGTPSLSRSLLLPAGAQEARGALTSVLVQTLLDQDRLVRVAAASLAFNVGAWVQIMWRRSRGNKKSQYIDVRTYE